MGPTIFNDYPAQPASYETKIGRPVPDEQSGPTELGINLAITAAVGYLGVQLPKDLDDTELIKTLFVHCGINPTEEVVLFSDEPSLEERADFVLGSLLEILRLRGGKVPQDLDGAAIAACFTRLELKKAREALA